MRLATVEVDGEPVLAVEVDGQRYRWSDVVDAPAATMLDALPLVCDGPPEPALGRAEPLPADARVLAPIPRPRRDLICLGKNFSSHATEFARSMHEDEEQPSAPIVFSKATTTVIGDGDDIVIPPETTEMVDYEVEVAVVLGRTARFVDEADAWDHIAGYTVLNDMTARDVQYRHRQWYVGKSMDGFAPMGPAIVSRDEIGDLDDVELTLHVDGEERQRGTCKQMIFKVPYVISFLSRHITLQPGDVLGMGTPEGVGMAMDPPAYLTHGQTAVAAASGIGEIRNRVVFS